MSENMARDIGQCYRHFIENVPHAVDIIMKVTGVQTPEVVKIWWKGRRQQKPMGYNYVRTLYFLTKNGYLVTEYESLTLEARRFMPVLVYGLAEPKAIALELGFKTKRPNDELLDYFRPHSRQGAHRVGCLKIFNDKHEATFAPIVQQKDEQLTEAAKDIARVALKLQSIPARSPLSEVELKNLHECITKALPLVRKLASDTSTEGDREQFRNMFPGTDFFEFKDWITALLGEDSRKIVIASREKFQ